MTRRRLIRAWTSASILLAAVVVVAALAASPAGAQPVPGAPDRDEEESQAVRIFLDCELCDLVYLRQEIPYVNYVRDARQAQVHVFVTRQPTASGGQELLLSFIGQEVFTGMNVRLTYLSAQGETLDERRRGLTNVIRTGLVPYLASTPLASQMTVTVTPFGAAPLRPASDAWNSWVFEVYGGGNYGAESTTSEVSVNYGVFAQRVTEDWKFQVRPYGNLERDRFQPAGGTTTLTSSAHRNGLNVKLVKSVSAHWSAGVLGNALSSTYENKDRSLRVNPAIEYSVFPYREAARRELTFVYRLGAERVRYLEETIFGRTEETIVGHGVEMELRLRQPWGSVDAEVAGSHLLRDTSINRVDVAGRLSWRLVKGLSLTVSSRAALIHDQLFLPRGAASVEDVLLRRRTFATSYRVSGAVGFSYTFGSIYNNVVNPRL